MADLFHRHMINGAIPDTGIEFLVAPHCHVTDAVIQEDTAIVGSDPFTGPHATSIPSSDNT